MDEGHEVEKVEKLTKHELEHVQIVSASVSHEVTNNNVSSRLCRLRCNIKRLLTEILKQKFELSAFPHFPEKMWRIA